MDTIVNLESLQVIEPNFALIYGKLVRHITAARLHLVDRRDLAALGELDEAMDAIKAFENPAFVIGKQPCPPSS
jgi:hypothetical protein